MADGEFLSLVGPSGCGKTTLLRAVSGLLKIDAGEIRHRGRKVEGVPRPCRSCFQEYNRSLFPWLSVDRNVRFPLKGVPKAEADQRVGDALRVVGLEDFAGHYPWQLSGGMQQRVAIARSVAAQAEILLMDEPFASVDAQTRISLEMMLLELWERLSISVLFVTHDIEEAILLSDRVLVLSQRPSRVHRRDRGRPAAAPRPAQDEGAPAVPGAARGDLRPRRTPRARTRLAPCHDAGMPQEGTLAQRLLGGDRRALARGISLVEDDDPRGWELVREVYPQTGNAAVVGITGAPGAGKSTLIGALITRRRAVDRSVAVLSIDPSSPFTQGALLGDRIRLTEHFLDPGVFIRSMANRGALGGLSEATLQAALLMDAAGRDDVYLETVGVGQAEVDVIDHADTVVLVLMPGSGDSIQALKAGIMEIPDIIVVNKREHPLTDTMVREIKGILSLAPARDWTVPVITTEAVKGEGVDELVDTIAEHRAHIVEQGTLSERRRRNLRAEIVALAASRLRRRLEAGLDEDPEFARLLDEVVARRVDPASAAASLLERQEAKDIA